MMSAFIFSILVLCSLSMTSFTEATKIQSGFSVDLIHADSPLSPFYNPSLTPSQRIKNAALRSIARSNHYCRSKNQPPRSFITPDLYNGGAEYLMKYYIGTPPVERLAIADTGSDLIWVQCSPCKKCVPQNTPLFNPKKSSTFRNVSCDSQPCTLLSINQRRCGNSGECNFRYAYDTGDTYTIGKLGVESINFDSKGGVAIKNFPKLTFGCAYYNNINDNDNDGMKNIKPKNTGLVGLGAGPLSLISQLGAEIGYKFSYCLVPFYSNFTSKLKFGHEAKIKGKGVVSTPLIIKSSVTTFYYLNLEGISIGKKMVKTNKSQTQGNMIIDSGTTFTVLHQSFYTKFVNMVSKVFEVEPMKNPPEGFKICYNGEGKKFTNKYRGSDDDDAIPDFVFHFTGAKVRLKLENLFRFPSENMLCLTVEATAEQGTAIFGNQAQVGFQVEYDLKGEKVSFAPADCTKH